MASKYLQKLGKISTNGRRFMSTTPVSEPLANLSVKTATPSAEVLEFSTLSNGIRVATVKREHTTGAAVGLYIRSGTRNETTHTFGSSVYLKRMGFQSTNTRTSLRLARELELMGANYRVSVGRESTAYSAELPADRVNEVLPILSDVATPALLDWEVRDELHAIEDEAKRLERYARTVVFELLHTEAFRNNGLGNSLLPPTHNLHHLNADSLTQWVLNNYTADRIAVVAVGNVAHAQIAERANLVFGNIREKSQATDTKSVYVGGDVRLAADCDTHMAIGFQGAAHGSKDAAALSTLQFLLGSGNSFNDAIGNGVTSRLYRDVSKDENFVKEVSAFNVHYSDSGLFGIFAIGKQGFASKLSQGIVASAKSIVSGLDAAQLNSAKNRYKSDLYFTNETRNNYLEFLGNQALLAESNAKELPSLASLAKAVDSVTVEDVKRVAQRTFSSKPTLIAVGDVQNIPSADQITKLFQ